MGAPVLQRHCQDDCWTIAAGAIGDAHLRRDEAAPKVGHPFGWALGYWWAAPPTSGWGGTEARTSDATGTGVGRGLSRAIDNTSSIESTKCSFILFLMLSGSSERSFSLPRGRMA